jgi:hypothetical protein
MNKHQYLESIGGFFHACVQTVANKSADYATDDDPFLNFRMCESVGIASLEAGIIVRMCDKMSRLVQLTKHPAAVKSESIQDTCLDLANYSAILATYLSQMTKEQALASHESYLASEEP